MTDPESRWPPGPHVAFHGFAGSPRLVIIQRKVAVATMDESGSSVVMKLTGDEEEKP